MRICFSSGHGKLIRGASASPRPPYLDEVDEARKVVEKVAEYWRQSGVECRTFHDDTSTSQNQNLSTITNWHNAQWPGAHDYDVSCHFNAYAKYTAAQKPNGMGAEVLYKTQSSLASKVSAAIATAGTFINRGGKLNNNLAFLNNTKAKSILLEVCFVDAEVDGNKYRQNFDKICRAIAESISGVKIPTVPVEPPVEPPPVDPPYTEDNVIEITSQWSTSDVRVIVNGSVIQEGAPDTPHTVEFGVKKRGDVLLILNDEEFHNWPEEEVPPTEPPTEPELPPPYDPYAKPQASRPTIRRGSKGIDVSDLQLMLNQNGATLVVDSDFGGGTESAVVSYQSSRGLGADGIVGQQTWGALYAKTPALPPPAWGLSTQEATDIMAIANSSPIRNYSWQSRGKAPAGYTQGMALAFASSYKKLLVGHAALVKIARARTSSDKDALNIYRSKYEALGYSNETAGRAVLRNLYGLMLGSGMRESSGKYCEGRDMSASNVTSDTAEAGLFQTSYNANSANPAEFNGLMTEYQADANKAACYTGQFAQGVSCSSSSWACYGSGKGYDFQKLCKDCPAFATETHALTLRNLANHYGPIIRQEAELRSDAIRMFQSVADYLDAGKALVA